MEVVSTLKVGQHWIPPDIDGVAVSGLLSDLASGVVGIIRKRVGAGRDIDRSAFRPYTKPYALRRIKEGAPGGAPKQPRLFWSGALMKGLQEIANAGNKSEVGWLDDHLRDIAAGLEGWSRPSAHRKVWSKSKKSYQLASGPLRALPGRKFFGIRSKEERMEVGTIGNNFMDALVRKSRGR